METTASPATTSQSARRAAVEVFRYDDQIVRMFVLATLIWGFVGMLVGVIIASRSFCPRPTSANT
jgi:cbb3-type cytochrome oxidase subunit 1